MPKLLTAQQQALAVISQLESDVTSKRSTRTLFDYKNALKNIAEFAIDSGIKGGLLALTEQDALSYLAVRSEEVGQTSLNRDRMALQTLLKEVTKVLKKDQYLPKVKSELPTVVSSRAYTGSQVDLICQRQSERYALSTQIAYAAGLRAHELLTLQLPDKQPVSNNREAMAEKFSGLAGVIYTVSGKGDLIREVIIPNYLSVKIQSFALETSVAYVDRGVTYHLNYDLAGGQRWSNSFSQASRAAIDRSSGAHGVRHSYAQERLKTLQKRLPRDKALLCVAQELGHHDPEITEVYLR